jgi:ASTRA-associated protein 1
MLRSFLPSHSRDHKLHAWRINLESASGQLLDSGSATLPGLQSNTPTLLYSMDVNALNYCRFSLFRLDGAIEEEPQALIALPNLVESSLVNMYPLLQLDVTPDAG